MEPRFLRFRILEDGRILSHPEATSSLTGSPCCFVIRSVKFGTHMKADDRNTSRHSGTPCKTYGCSSLVESTHLLCWRPSVQSRLLPEERPKFEHYTYVSGKNYK